MLPIVNYNPSEGDLLFHYCSPETFGAICSSRRLRFSDLFSMNDAHEIYWGYHIWETAASRLLEKVGRDFLNRIDEIISASGLHILPVAACFSMNGDLLSQWRAYAQDATGYAIGFDASVLTQLPVRPLRVLYDEELQVREVVAAVKALHKVESETEGFSPEDFFSACVGIAADLAAFKNPFFHEEQEIRLLHLLNFEESGRFLRLVDTGGTCFGQQAEPEPIQFTFRQSVPVVHIDLDFTNSGNVNPIRRVITGPKNEAAVTGVAVYLETLGLSGVQVHKSKGAYR